MASPATAGSRGRLPASVLGSLAGVEIASIAAGLVAAYLSLAFVGVLGLRLSPADTCEIYISVAIASAAVGLLYWRALTSQEFTLTLGQGILLGIGSSLLAHPLMWVLALLINDLTADPSMFLGMSWQGQPSAPAMVLTGTLLFTFYGLVFVGWITSLVGGIAGGVLAWLGARGRRVD